jgi:hypothetical protein
MKELGTPNRLLETNSSLIIQIRTLDTMLSRLPLRITLDNLTFPQRFSLDPSILVTISPIPHRGLSIPPASLLLRPPIP